MKKIKAFISQVPLLILWLMGSVLLWGWIFTRITDTVPEKKVTVFVDGEVPRSAELSAALEETMPEGIRMIRVHPFSYAMLDSSTLRGADIYLVKASDAERYRDWFAPLPEALRPGGIALMGEDAPACLPAYDAGAGRGAAASYIAYEAPGAQGENYYLFFGAASLHVPEREGAVDDAAVAVAQALLSLQ